MLIKSLVLIALFQNTLFAYLDPASGSLLLSSIIAIFVSVAFFFKNLFYKIINFSPRYALSSLSSINGGGESRKF
ncbi:hypothetical protein CCY99_06245 [Helicobacter sp. 16-1353]|nr:hypothetical protein CCY99_06245 [Helicobacter sp. 16-1353]